MKMFIFGEETLSEAKIVRDLLFALQALPGRAKQRMSQSCFCESTLSRDFRIQDFLNRRNVIRKGEAGASGAAGFLHVAKQVLVPKRASGPNFSTRNAVNETLKPLLLMMKCFSSEMRCFDLPRVSAASALTPAAKLIQLWFSPGRSYSLSRFSQHSSNS